MAQIEIIQLVSDISGTVMKSGEGQTVRFGWLGQEFEVDLTQKEADQFAKVLEPYLGGGRKLAKNGKAYTKTTVAPKRADLNEIRAWANKKGMEVSDRGRVAKDIIEAYDEAHKG